MPPVIKILYGSDIPAGEDFEKLSIPPILQKVSDTQIIFAYFDTPAVKDLSKVALFPLDRIIPMILPFVEDSAFLAVFFDYVFFWELEGKVGVKASFKQWPFC